MAGHRKPKVEVDQPELPLDATSAPETTDEIVDEEPVAEVIEPAPEPVAETPEVVVVETKEPAPVFVGATLPSTADEQLAGQLALIAAKERLEAEIEMGKKAVAEAEARMRAAG